VDHEQAAGSKPLVLGPSAGLGPWRSTVPPAGFTPFPDLAVEGSVADRFAATAAAHRDATALRSPAGSWTYRELAEQVDRWAAGIQALVPCAEARPVAILAGHDGPLVAAMMAVLTAGHLVVVLDPQAPSDHTALVLQESGAALLLHDPVHATGAEGLLAAVATPPAACALDDLPAAELRAVRRGPDDPIMLAFTSGTSGTPKGAIITNGVLMNLVRGATNALGIKGAGEAGTIGATPAALNAVTDALWRAYGIRHIEMPATPASIWAAIQGASSA